MVEHYFPQGTLYAFGGDKALQVWYRDTTLHWMPFEDFAHDPQQHVSTIVEYQPSSAHQVVLVSPEAMRAHLRARESVRTSRWMEGLAAADASDSLQQDRDALVLLSSNAYHRAYCLAAIGRLPEAEKEARRALALGQVNRQARFVLSLIYVSEGRRSEGERQLDTLLTEAPGDADALELLRSIRRP